MPVEASARRERSQPALRLPGGLTSDPADPRLAGLADLVDEVAACLDPSLVGPAGQPLDLRLRVAVARCTAEAEGYLEAQRERELRASAAEDELRGLAAQLRSDRGDATLIVRRLRRILGRVDDQRRGGSAR